MKHRDPFATISSRHQGSQESVDEGPQGNSEEGKSLMAKS